VIVSGIGCSSRFPGFVTTYGYHGVHGRALPTAMGVKMANPELEVIAVGGDGDGFAIGGGHFPHAARRNVDITYVVMDNEIYGLTKGQVSPTSLHDQKSPSSPYGNVEDPLSPLASAIAADASFVARGASFRTKELTELIIAGIQNPGFSFIDALSPCTAFNNTTQLWKADVSELDEKHDPADRAAAFAKAIDDPMALGIFYKHQRMTMAERLQAARDAADPTTTDELLDSYALGLKVPTA
jgi:2-oxoglutarate ferredoxin oxidoreductase subunit beta